MKLCTLDGCEKVHRARGLCATHYNQQHQPNRHKRVPIGCAQCGMDTLKLPTKRYPNRFCSLNCRDAFNREQTRRRRALPVLWVKAKPDIKRPAQPQTPNAWTAGKCRVCGTPYISRWWMDATCSDECAEVKRLADKREHRHRRRARERGAYVAPVFRVRIYQRDGWRCQICMRKVKKDAVAPHPLSPTIDHVVALSIGGTHEPVNVRLACFQCNATRGARQDTVQLALIG